MGIKLDEHNERVRLQRQMDKLEEEDKGDAFLGWALAFIAGCFILLALLQVPKALDTMWQQHHNKPEYVKQAEAEQKIREIEQGQ
jgi:hypothetical protein